MVLGRVKNLPKAQQAAIIIKQWSALKTHFGKSYKEINDDQFVEAVSLLARLPLEGELIINNHTAVLVEPEKKFTLELTEQELKNLCWLWKMAELMRQLIGMVQKPLELLGSRLSGSAWGFSHEYKFPIETARKILVKATQDIQTDTLDSNGWNNVIHELRRGEANGIF